MAIMKCEPFGRNMSALPGFRFMKEHMDRMFNEAYGSESAEVTQSDWIPFADVSENQENYIIHAEVPGLSKKDIKITLQDDVLTISGVKELNREKKDHTYHLVERTYGQFSRAFTLPGKVEEENIKAEFKNGVLEIVLPKTPAAKAREIKIEHN